MQDFKFLFYNWGEDLHAGTRPRAVGKRTPRVPIASIRNRDSPSMGVKTEDDEGAHVAAMALAEVFQRGGSPQVAHTPSRHAATVKASTKKVKDKLSFFKISDA
jgi:hypothetical protein